MKFLTLTQRLRRPLALDAGAQNSDAKGQVSRQFFQELLLLYGKGVRLSGIEIESAERVSGFVLERQSDTGAIAALQGAIPPGGGLGVGGEILRGALSAPDGASAGAAPPFRVGPGKPGLFEIPILEPGPGDRAYAPGVIVFGISHPGHSVTGLVADDAADVVEQGLLVLGPHQELVTVADGQQLAIQPMQRLLRPLLLRDVLHHLNSGGYRTLLREYRC